MVGGRRRGAWAALLFTGLGAAPHGCEVPSGGGACGRWIEVEGRGVCGVEGLRGLLTLCPPDEAVRVGARLRVLPRWPVGCVSRVARMAPAARLAVGQRLEINVEPAEALRAVRGVGPSTARALVRARPYTSPADLERARGVGPRRRAQLRASLRLSPPPLLWPSRRPPGGAAPRRP